MEGNKTELDKLKNAIKDTFSILRQEEKKEDGRYIVDKYTTIVYLETKEGKEEESPYIHVYSDVNTKGYYKRAEYYEFDERLLAKELKEDIIKLGLETKEQRERRDKLLKEITSLKRVIKSEELNLFETSEDLGRLSNMIEIIVKNKERLYKEYPEMEDFDSPFNIMYGNSLSTSSIKGALRAIQERAEYLIEQLQKGEEKYYG